MKANVVNNLTTTASGKALDGRQGKVLNDKITNLNNDMIKSYVGMIIISSTLDTQAKVIEVYGGTTWVMTSKGKCLFGADGTNYIAGQTKEAGLPNITGQIDPVATDRTSTGFNTKTGVFTDSTNNSLSGANAGSGTYRTTLKFDASKSNSIYGKSTTVQPPALVVYIWERTV